MKVVVALLLLLGIFGAAIVPSWLDRGDVASRVTLAACADDLDYAAAGDPSLSWRLPLADSARDLTESLTNEQLIGLGFDRHAVGMIGSALTPEFDPLKPRPVWLSLRPDSGAASRLVVNSVALRREKLQHRPDEIVVQARLGFSFRPHRLPAEPDDSVNARGARMTAPLIGVEVLELIPVVLHLTPATEAAIRKNGARGPACRFSPVRLVISTGRRGSLLIEPLPTNR